MDEIACYKLQTDKKVTNRIEPLRYTLILLNNNPCPVLMSLSVLGSSCNMQLLPKMSICKALIPHLSVFGYAISLLSKS